MAVKALGIYAVARIFAADHREAVQRSALFAQVANSPSCFMPPRWLPASSTRVRRGDSAIVILSMAAHAVVVLLLDRFLPPPSRCTASKAACLTGRVLIIGFGRFGQVVSQPLLARDVDISIIDVDVDMIQAAGDFGFKVYYGDGTRLDVLRTSGAGKADAILVCIDQPELADRIVALAKHQFPQAQLYVRSFDRGHALRLIQRVSTTRCARRSNRRWRSASTCSKAWVTTRARSRRRWRTCASATRNRLGAAVDRWHHRGRSLMRDDQRRLTRATDAARRERAP